MINGQEAATRRDPLACANESGRTFPVRPSGFHRIDLVSGEAPGRRVEALTSPADEPQQSLRILDDRSDVLRRYAGRSGSSGAEPARCEKGVAGQSRKDAHAILFQRRTDDEPRLPPIRHDDVSLLNLHPPSTTRIVEPGRRRTAGYLRV